MTAKTLSMNDVKAMNAEQLTALLADTKAGLTAAMKQACKTRLANLNAAAASAPVESAQASIAGEAVTEGAAAPEASASEEKKEEAAPAAKVAKNKPFETTRTIEAFKDDTKGIRAGTRVEFLENNKPGAKLMTGTVQRLFDFYAKPERQEAKIKGDNGQRYYRFEKDIKVHVPAPEVPAETAPEASSEASEEAKG